MSVLDSIMMWAENYLPPWQSDGVRRLLTQATLTEADKEELLALLKAEYGLSSKDTIPIARPLKRGDISGVAEVQSKVILKAMKEMRNVNAIPDGSSLPFGHEGLTVVYGENATGKSGYARVLKRACKARDTEERIHPNIYRSTSGVAKAIFKISIDGMDKELDWEDGRTEIDALANIAVFDSKCARIIVDKKNELSYLPYGAHVFEGLVSLMKDLKARLEREKPKPEILKYDDIPEDTKVGQLIYNMTDQTTKENVEKLAVWSEEDESRLVELQKHINRAEAEDPVKLADKIRKKKARIEELKEKILYIERATSSLKSEELQKAIIEINAAEKAVQIVSQESLSNEPLSGTGGSAWKKLYDAAREYSTKEAYPGREFPEIGEGSRCVLCMQPLLEDAIARFKRFKEFMEKTTMKAADSAREKLEMLVKALEKLDFEIPNTYKDAVDEIREKDVELATEVKQYFDTMQHRTSDMIKACKEKISLDLKPVTTSPAEKFVKIVQNLETEADVIEKAADPEKLAELKSERNELKARKLLSERREKIVKYLEELRTAKKYERCIDGTKHWGITKRGTEIISSAVTENLISLVNQELKELGAYHININLKPSGGYGETSHQIELPDSQISAKTKLTEIFSEGELTVVGISGFLAELKLADHKSTIVFDDPVCSLDHKYREKVAERLAKETAVRQVIIFTHDISFLLELSSKAAGLDNVKFFAQTVKLDDAPGRCTEGLPWHSMPVKRRLSHLNDKLNNIRGIWDTNKEEYNRESGYIYGLLRESWEAAIEEVLFHNVVKRYSGEVRTMELRYVTVTDEDYKKVYSGMSKCSKWMFGHDKAKALDVNRPPPGEIQEDIEELSNFVKDVHTREKVIENQRKTCFEPQTPKIG